MVTGGIPLDRKFGFSILVTGGERLDSVAPDGGRPGSSYELLRDQVLDPWGVKRCLLTYNVGEYGSHPNPYVSRDLCTAANDWNLDQWLGRDDRLYSGIVVSGMLPEEAAEEIHRLGDHPKMCAVIIGGVPLGRPLGDPLYHPIYEAASEHGLAIVTHLGLAVSQSAKAVGGSIVSVTEESLSLALLGGQTVSSFIVHGVFEKFPGIRLVLNEFGLSWLVPTLWNLDNEYDSLARESPWVRRLPSEYARDHVHVSTQPLETAVGANGRELADYLGSLEGIEDLICFSSDYPHYTMDDYAFVARVLPDDWHRKVFFENACSAFGWSDFSASLEKPVGAPAP